MKKLVVFLLPALVAAACTTVETAPGNSSGTSTGSGGAASSTSGTGGVATSTSGGFGGNGGGLVTASSGGFGGFGDTTVGSTSSGGPTGCAGVDTFIDVVGDGPMQHFTSLCANTYVLGNPTGPVAYTPTSGGNLPVLTIAGCSSSAQGAPGLSLGEAAPNAPGSDTNANGSYTDLSQTFWSSMNAGDVVVTLTNYQDVGGVVEGSYVAKLQSNGMTKALSGSFRACHVYDIPKP